MSWRTAGAAAAAGLLAAACAGPADDAGSAAGTPPPAPALVFTDVTAQSGVDFVHTNGASERRYLPETMGSGLAFFDYDGDGRPDLFLVDGAPVEAGAGGSSGGGALYHNLGGGRFAEVTADAGLAAEPFLGMGAAVGDYDNDGWLDLFVSGVGEDRLYRNSGGRFTEVGRELGLGPPGFSASAAFLDYDNDGWLDLFIARYVDWSRRDDRRCSPDGEHASYCTPEVYPGASSRLLRNLGGGGFTDVTAAAGLDLVGKALGVVPLDHDGDGRADLAVANDTVRNFLFVNREGGGFEEIGLAAGMALSESGATRGGMGIDAGDLTGNGRPDLVVGNFGHEMSAVYLASERGVYSDEAAPLGVGLPTLMTLAFGTLVADLDGDGWLDLVFANGHIEPEIGRWRRLSAYAQPLQLFHNRAGGELAPVDGEGTSWQGPWVARGLAAADIDGDGDLDLALTQNGGPARLLRNDSAGGSWLRLELVGTAGNRTGYGARVVAEGGGRRWVRSLVSGRSYLSASEPVLTLGLGDLERLERLVVHWPSGTVQQVDDPPLGRTLRLVEPVSGEPAEGR